MRHLVGLDTGNFNAVALNKKLYHDITLKFTCFLYIQSTIVITNVSENSTAVIRFKYNNTKDETNRECFSIRSK